MAIKLGAKSLKKLEGVHPDLVAVVKRAAELSENEFTVGEGVRTLETQKAYVRKGVSKTLRSRHIPELNASGLGCAVDLWPLMDIDKDGDLDVVWDAKYYPQLARIVKQAAEELNISVDWGFDLWGWDMPHFQLNTGAYPWKK